MSEKYDGKMRRTEKDYYHSVFSRVVFLCHFLDLKENTMVMSLNNNNIYFGTNSGTK